MAEPRSKIFVPIPYRFGAAPVFLALLLGTQSGCTREFFREWANQDVSEAVFEKSRDPRWRLDMFSVEPPAMSRFADPYDQDFPPAPPDDHATEALSPVPQSPDHRLIMPPEGTGYVEMLERWQAERDALPKKPSMGNTNRPGGVSGPMSPNQPVPPPRPSEMPSPFAPGTAPPQASTWKPDQKSGAAASQKTPILLADARSSKLKTAIPPPRSASSFAVDQSGRVQPAVDGAVVRTSQEAVSPDNSVRGVRPGDSEKKPLGQPDPTLSPSPPITLDPNPNERDMADPNLPRPGELAPAGPEGGFTQEQAAELSGILVPSIPDIDEVAAAGLPEGSRPYKVTMQQAFALSLINSRSYQSQLESLYGAALAVTLQRFRFQPQFYAGLTPQTAPVGGIAGLNPRNAFNYQTRYAPGGQVSALAIGDVAGVGKLLNSGGQLVAGFANQVIFNFVGKNPIQPSVQSSLPLSFFQPFLRGGGRAVILEALTQAERNLLYQVRSFAKFRQEYIVALLSGSQAASLGTGFGGNVFTSGSNTDPVVGYIPVAFNLAQVGIDRRNVAYFEQLVNLYTQLIDGESSGLTQLQVDQARSNLVSARLTLVQDTLRYRLSLDQFKQQLGLPPDLPMIVDLSLVDPFSKVWDSIDDWQRNPRRDLKDLPTIVGRVPTLEDVVIDGRSMLHLYQGSTTFSEEEELEDILQAGVRTALEYRLDLMNARAQLYDTWRQIRFQANSLKGILNVGITNQVLTPPTTTNPFGFFSQATQFSLVLNAELPLIRMAERNNFRAAIISYQRQRRNLQNVEDSLKVQLRQDIRTLQVAAINYAISKQVLELNIRLKDQAFEQIIAPPQGGTGQGLAQAANAATQTSNLISFQQNLVRAEGQLQNAWQSYQLARLSLYRDIGTLPYDEWEAFSELFPAEYRGPSLGSGTSDTRSAGSPAAETAAAVAR